MGQFQNGQKTLGWTFLTAESLLLVANVAMAPIWYFDRKNAFDAYTAQDLSASQSYLARANTVQVLNEVFLGTLVGTALLGIAHAELTFVPESVEPRLPQRFPSLSELRPTLGPATTGQGALLGVVRAFLDPGSFGEARREHLTAAMEATHHRADRDAERVRGFAVALLLEVDERDHGSEAVRECVEMFLRARCEFHAAIGRRKAVGHGPRTRVDREDAQRVTLATASAVTRDEDAEQDLLRPRAEAGAGLLVLRREAEARSMVSCTRSPSARWRGSPRGGAHARRGRARAPRVRRAVRRGSAQ